MKLDERTLRLIAVGAPVTANCQPCLEINIANALQCGVDEQAIAEAIQVGKKVRKGAAAKMDVFAAHLNAAAPVSVPSMEGRCGCDDE